MKIKFNGEEKETTDGITVKEILEEQGIKGEGIAVAKNNELVFKTDWETTELKDGDDLLVINAAYGG